MLQNLVSAIKTSTFRQTAITSSGTLINGVLGIVFYIYLARLLGPSNFGVFSISIVTLTLIADITNFGTNTGIVNFVSRYAKSDPSKSDQFLKLALKIKLLTFVSILILGNILTPIIVNNIFYKPELELPFRLVLIGVGSALLFSFATSTLQAFQKFSIWSGIQIATNAFRLITVIAFGFISSVTVLNSIFIYLLYPFIGFLMVFVFVPSTFLKAKDENERFLEFFSYNKWIATFAILTAVSSRLDTFLAVRFLDSVQIGIYAAATQLVQFVPQVISAVGAVMAPKIASMTNKSDLVSYLKKTQLMLMFFALIGLLTIPVAEYVIPYLYGDAYMNVFDIFTLLMIAMLIFMISIPTHQTVLHYYEYPKLFSMLSVFNLLMTFCLGWIMISSYGIVGAAITVLIVQIVNLLIPLSWVVIKLRKE